MPLEGARVPTPTWKRTWYAPCDDPDTEFRALQVPKDTADRLVSWPVRPVKSRNAMRIEVLQEDWAWNPAANGGAGARIEGGWRAEGVGPEETQSDRAVRYKWATMLDVDYASDPRVADGDQTWQVVFQWHQGASDQGQSPPVALTIVGDHIHLDIHVVKQQSSVRVGQ